MQALSILYYLWFCSGLSIQIILVCPWSIYPFIHTDTVRSSIQIPFPSVPIHSSLSGLSILSGLSYLSLPFPALSDFVGPSGLSSLSYPVFQPFPVSILSKLADRISKLLIYKAFACG